MIKSGDLENRHVDTNAPAPITGAAGVQADLERVRGGRPRTLEQRIADARSLTPPEGREPESWAAGRDAALRAIEAP
jgi:hypothetical protein